jgi:hypothetical protein
MFRASRELGNVTPAAKPLLDTDFGFDENFWPAICGISSNGSQAVCPLACSQQSNDLQQQLQELKQTTQELQQRIVLLEQQIGKQKDVPAVPDETTASVAEVAAVLLATTAGRARTFSGNTHEGSGELRRRCYGVIVAP